MTNEVKIGGNVTGSTVFAGDVRGGIKNTYRSQNLEEQIDYVLLAEQLTKLREALKKEPETEAKDIAIGKITEAKLAADNEDIPSVLRHLKGAGQIALDVAQKIGVSIAIEFLKKAIGS